MPLTEHQKQIRKAQREREKGSEEAREGRNRRARNRYERLVQSGLRWNPMSKVWEKRPEIETEPDKEPSEPINSLSTEEPEAL